MIKSTKNKTNTKPEITNPVKHKILGIKYLGAVQGCAHWCLENQWCLGNGNDQVA
jgi:hypothetical protein